jgi:hypothetical protein
MHTSQEPLGLDIPYTPVQGQGSPSTGSPIIALKHILQPWSNPPKAGRPPRKAAASAARTPTLPRDEERPAAALDMRGRCSPCHLEVFAAPPAAMTRTGFPEPTQEPSKAAPAAAAGSAELPRQARSVAHASTADPAGDPEPSQGVPLSAAAPAVSGGPGTGCGECDISLELGRSCSSGLLARLTRACQEWGSDDQLQVPFIPPPGQPESLPDNQFSAAARNPSLGRATGYSNRGGDIACFDGAAVADKRSSAEAAASADEPDPRRADPAVHKHMQQGSAPTSDVHAAGSTAANLDLLPRTRSRVYLPKSAKARLATGSGDCAACAANNDQGLVSHDSDADLNADQENVSPGQSGGAPLPPPRAAGAAAQGPGRCLPASDGGPRTRQGNPTGVPRPGSSAVTRHHIGIPSSRVSDAGSCHSRVSQGSTSRCYSRGSSGSIQGGWPPRLGSKPAYMQTTASTRAKEICTQSKLRGRHALVQEQPPKPWT